ncbi:GAF domain-containing protein [Luteolibacter pohnpeiensis]|uniref:GAF domain-containing protein n=1 Tax=Luteolibacter pohnpeiensis TaxID=454153 RepID=A0A934S179_9BACT|nr:GAF domain-containing protein [Luteolibacter pohnpeiensis]MBK1881365.1 GAF domain-containing protein [Luteolibacter pohnpeiensis]
MLNTTEWEQALQNCADEKIQLIGQVQANSVLIAIDVEADRFKYLSANASAVLGPDTFFEASPVGVFGEGQISMFHRRARSWRGRGPRMVEILFPYGPPVPGWVHVRDGLLILETELKSNVEEAHQEQDPDDWEDAMRDGFHRVEICTDLASKLKAVATEVWKLGNFDRVMIYQFLPDDTGEVVAEEVRDDWEPYFGLRYPASDIPPQARALFLENDIRLINHVVGEPVPLLSAADVNDKPLDLSLCRYRQPAAVHLEYLRNMGVGGSFVSAIISEGKLWGLISCHHGTGLHLSAVRQMQLSALTTHLALELSGMARELRLRDELAGARIANKLIQCVTMTDDWASVLLSMSGDLCQLLHADGMSLHFQDQTYSSGLVPDPGAVAALAKSGMERTGSTPITYQRIPDDKATIALPPEIGGYLLIPLSHFRDDALIFFRKEQTVKIKWAGDPVKGLDRSSGAPRLKPRASFEVWQETVSGTCELWTPEEVKLSIQIGATLSDVVITAHHFRKSMEAPGAIRHRLAHESSAEPVLLADESGFIVFQNHAAVADPILGGLHSLDHLASRLDPADQEQVSNAIHQLAATGLEIRLDLKDGRLEVTCLIEDERLVGYSIRLVQVTG